MSLRFRSILPVILPAIFTVVACVPAQGLDPLGEKASYEFAGVVLTRVQGDRREEILCTEPGGTGEIHGVVRGPTDTVYIAADRGLFSLSDDVRHSTPLPLGAGSPKGRPVAIAVDDYGTIWLQTTEGFGCVEPVHLFGQVVDRPATEIPEWLESFEDGVLKFRSPAGVSEYRPGEGPAPSLEILSADAAPVDGVIHVRVAAKTRGAPIYGWRLLRRHRYEYQRTPEFELANIEPGKHQLEFVVFDQDLRRSAGKRIEVRVPYPKTYSKAVAVPAILLAAMMILGALLFRARRGGGGRVLYWKAMLSTFLVFAVGLQVVAGLIPHSRGWPFVGYSMYSQSYAPGEHIYTAVMIGIRGEGRRFRLDPAVAGYPSDGYWQALLPLVYGDDVERQRFVDAFNKISPHKPLVGFVIQDEKHRLTVEGPIEVAPVVMCVYPRGVLRESK